MLPSEELLLVSYLPCRVDASAAVMMLRVPHILYYYVFLLLPTCVLQRRTGTHIGSFLHINDVSVTGTLFRSLVRDPVACLKFCPIGCAVQFPRIGCWNAKSLQGGLTTKRSTGCQACAESARVVQQEPVRQTACTSKGRKAARLSLSNFVRVAQSLSVKRVNVAFSLT